jgi:hypothetical protein
MAATVDMAVAAGAVKAVPAVAAVRAVKVAPVVRAAVPVGLAAASANSSARRKFASSAWKKWISSITNAPTFFLSLCRNAAKFCRAA